MYYTQSCTHNNIYACVSILTCVFTSMQVSSHVNNPEISVRTLNKHCTSNLLCILNSVMVPLCIFSGLLIFLWILSSFQA